MSLVPVKACSIMQAKRRINFSPLIYESNCAVRIHILYSSHPRLSVKQTRILQLDEDVLCVRYSPNQKILAAALLDCTVKIFYTDTLKVTSTTLSLDIKLMELIEIHLGIKKFTFLFLYQGPSYTELILSCDQRKEGSDSQILILFCSSCFLVPFARNNSFSL